MKFDIIICCRRFPIVCLAVINTGDNLNTSFEIDLQGGRSLLWILMKPKIVINILFSKLKPSILINCFGRASRHSTSSIGTPFYKSTRSARSPAIRKSRTKDNRQIEIQVTICEERFVCALATLLYRVMASVYAMPDHHYLTPWPKHEEENGIVKAMQDKRRINENETRNDACAHLIGHTPTSSVSFRFVFFFFFLFLGSIEKSGFSVSGGSLFNDFDALTLHLQLKCYIRNINREMNEELTLLKGQRCCCLLFY